MKRIFSLIAFVAFSQTTMAKVVIELTDRATDGTQTVSTCENYQTILTGKNLEIATQCNSIGGKGTSIHSDIAQNAGYSLGELQKLILDYDSNAGTLITVKILSIKGQAAALGVTTLKQ